MSDDTPSMTAVLHALTIETAPGAAYRLLLGQGFHVSAVMRQLTEASRAGYINHGAMVSSGWITDKGREALAGDA